MKDRRGYSVTFCEWSMVPIIRQRLNAKPFIWLKGKTSVFQPERKASPTNAYETILIASHNRRFDLPFSTNVIEANQCSSTDFLRNEKGTKVNPAQKPIPLLKWILSSLVSQCRTNDQQPFVEVIDAFAGTASTAVAAIELGLNVTIVEASQEQIGYALTRIQNTLQSVTIDSSNYGLQLDVDDCPDSFDFTPEFRDPPLDVPIENREELKRLKEFVNRVLAEQFPELVKGKPEHGVPRKSIFEPLRITLKDPNQKPIRQRPFRLAKDVQEFLEAKMMKEYGGGMWEPTTSAWSSGAFLAKDNRIVYNYPPLNGVTETIASLVISTTDIGDMCRGFAYAGSIDCTAAFPSVEIHPDSRQYLAVMTKNLFLQPVRMLFGFKNAPAWFTLQLNELLRDIKGTFIYMDDIYLFHQTLEDHMEAWYEVYRRLDWANLTIAPHKSKIGFRQFTAFGFVYTPEGHFPDPTRISAILKAEDPQDVPTLKSFLGSMGYYGSRYIPGYSALMEPLHRLTKKNVPFTWGKEQKEAKEALIELVAKDLSLAHFDPKLPVFLETDASFKGLAAVIYQVDEKGARRPLSWKSRALLPAEKNYSIIDLELTAIIWGTKVNISYLWCRPFTLCTDNLVAYYFTLFRTNDLSGRRGRYRLHLAGLNFKTILKKSKEMMFADWPSRCPARLTEEEIFAEMKDWQDINKEPIMTKRIEEAKAFVENSGLFQGIRIKEGGNCLRLTSTTDSRIDSIEDTQESSSSTELSVQSGPRSTTEDSDDDDNNDPGDRRPDDWLELVWLFHQLHHFGVEATYRMLRTYAHWRGMRECVKTVVANCDVCNRTANKFTWPSRPKARSRAVTTPFAEVEMDYNVKAVTQEFEGYKYILIIICTVSEFCVLIPCRTGTGEELIRRYRERYLSYFGNPKVIISDNEGGFISEVMSTLLRNVNTHTHTTTPYLTGGKGLVENVSREVTIALRRADDQGIKDWPSMLPILQNSLNNRFRVNVGMSSSQLALGRNSSILSFPEDPIQDWRKYWRLVIQILYPLANKNVTKAREAAAQRADNRRPDNAPEDPLEVMNLVYRTHPDRIRSRQGLSPNVPTHEGPMIIVYKHEDGVHYDLIDLVTGEEFSETHYTHILKVRRISRAQNYLTPNSGIIDEQMKILQHWYTEEGMLYQVRWSDSGDREWINSELLPNDAEALIRYWRNRDVQYPGIIEESDEEGSDDSSTSSN